ncbi:TetR/AcrR family transcriptional regulator [Uniformispora flossi]|uniref:TetR/AcrR family transcriptional regulator n=1 Tax=Uniformispora flossi TaxID=3390723 RepID=UPI003C2FEAA8
MPTGVHLRDARQQLFDAAERVLLRDGPKALTSRAVTDEAGCAKGVLHRHFADFDDFLAALVLDRAAGLDTQAADLRAAVGTGTVADNLTAALTGLFGPVPLAIIPLITFRDELRTRLRASTPGGGMAILGQATAAITAYLTGERTTGRIAPDTDIDSLTLSLVGGGHLLLASASDASPAAIHKFVSATIGPMLRT